MPALVTKTVRVKQAQKDKLDVMPKVSSHLVRELLDIYFSSKTPGQDILVLRNKINSTSQTA